MSPTSQATEQVATPQRIIESDLRQHIEDTPLFTVIRDNEFVELPWNALTAEEIRAIRVNLFCLYS